MKLPVVLLCFDWKVLHDHQVYNLKNYTFVYLDSSSIYVYGSTFNMEIYGKKKYVFSVSGIFTYDKLAKFKQRTMTTVNKV